MKLSILDQASIASGMSAGEALKASMELAQLGDELGYTRYWIAEHHDMSGLACSAPEVMLGYIGANTTRIRIGSGAVLLPHYRPYKVAEIYHMLAALFPGRIDIGIGRAPGGSAEATMALTDHYLEQVYKMPEKVEELLHFLRQDFPADHPYAKVTASPLPPVPPHPWILGTSDKSAMLAAGKGLAYAFGQFMSDQSGAEIVDSYQKHFQAGKNFSSPNSIVTVAALCAETAEKAEELSLSARLWRIQQGKGVNLGGVPSVEEAKNYPYTKEELEQMQAMRRNMVIGNPQEVKDQLQSLQAQYGTEEWMLVTITHSYEARLESYRLIAEEMGI